MIISAGLSEEFEFAISVGVGFNLAINLSKIIQEKQPKRLIFIGSMGLYTKDIDLFSIYEFSDASNVELSFLEGKSYTPLKIQNVNLNSSNYICKDYDLAQRLNKEFGFIGENMECYGLFSLAKAYNIPAKAILIATNYCDENSHENYVKNYKKANELLENYLDEQGLL